MQVSPAPTGGAPRGKAGEGAAQAEVADDVPVMLSEGEYVVPADVVRYWGLKHLEEMRTMAKCGLMSMQQDGRLHMVDEDGEPVETEAQSKRNELTGTGRKKHLPNTGYREIIISKR